MENMAKIKNQIVQALSHSEAENGLYLDNLRVVHEDEERNPVEGSDIEVLDALKELLSEGIVQMNETSENVIFSLSNK